MPPGTASAARHAAGRAGKTSRARGMTLIELLVAVTVLAVVAVLGWRGLDGIVRARLALNADLEHTRGLQLAFAQLQNDAEHLVASTTIPGRPRLAIEADRLRLVRVVSGYSQPTQLQVLTYRLANGVLSRRGSSTTRDLNELDALWLAAGSDAGSADDQPSIALQSGVTGMNLRLWATDNQGWRTADSQPLAATGDPAAVANAMVAAAVAGTVLTRSSLMGAAAAPEFNGLEISLSLQGVAAPLVKIMLLGPV
ncbi:MAG: PulJ/GspJ family protein [Janthinobacterium lividum]